MLVIFILILLILKFSFGFFLSILILYLQLNIIILVIYIFFMIVWVASFDTNTDKAFILVSHFINLFFDYLLLFFKLFYFIYLFFKKFSMAFIIHSFCSNKLGRSRFNIFRFYLIFRVLFNFKFIIILI